MLNGLPAVVVDDDLLYISMRPAVADAAKISPYDVTRTQGTAKAGPGNENRKSRVTVAAGSGRGMGARHVVRNVQSQRHEELDLNDEYPPYPPPSFQEAIASPNLSFQPENPSVPYSASNSDDDIDDSIEIVQMDSVPRTLDATERGRAKHRDELLQLQQGVPKRRQHLSLSPLRIFSFRDRPHQPGSAYSRSSPSITSLKGPGSASFLKLPLSSPTHSSGKPDFLGLLKGKHKSEHDTLHSWEFVVPPEDAPSLMSTVEAVTNPSTPLSCTPSPTQLTFEHRPSLDRRPEQSSEGHESNAFQKALQIPLPLSPIEPRAPPSSPVHGRHHYPGRPLPRAPVSSRYCVDSAYGPSEAFLHNVLNTHCPEELLIDFDGPVEENSDAVPSIQDELRVLMPDNGSLLDRRGMLKDKRLVRLQIPQ